jgi:hypothetical protein
MRRARAVTPEIMDPSGDTVRAAKALAKRSAGSCSGARYSPREIR